MVTGSNTGKWVANKARSTVGSHFAILSLHLGTLGDVTTDDNKAVRKLRPFGRYMAGSVPGLAKEEDVMAENWLGYS
jgi:hypothetical protein